MNLAGARSRRLFGGYAWGVLAWNIPVVLWGAYVRASFSGDGCGANWPSCNGQYLPGSMAAPTAIEFTHRMMTTVDTVAVVAMLLWALLAFPRRDAVRKYAGLSFLFLLIEALLGAGLVLFRYVAKDQSAGRVWYLSAHLVNTMLLLAALTCTAWLAYNPRERFRLLDISPRMLWALAAAVLVSVTGTITALGDTLFPAASLAAGMQQDFARTSNVLLRLRVLHPLLAVAAAAYILWIGANALRDGRKSWAASAVIAAVVLQIAVGMLNLALLAPLLLQLTHLFVADLVWIALIWLTLETATLGKMRARDAELAFETA